MGALAIRDDSASPPNLSLSDEGWPRIGDTRSNIASQSPMHEHCRMKNLNRPISSWEICQAQRQHEKREIELKHNLFTSPERQIELDISELDESSKRLEAAMAKVSQVR